jgi:hypothetical protein
VVRWWCWQRKLRHNWTFTACCMQVEQHERPLEPRRARWGLRNCSGQKDPPAGLTRSAIACCEVVQVAAVYHYI